MPPRMENGLEGVVAAAGAEEEEEVVVVVEAEVEAEGVERFFFDGIVCVCVCVCMCIWCVYGVGYLGEGEVVLKVFAVVVVSFFVWWERYFSGEGSVRVVCRRG